MDAYQRGVSTDQGSVAGGISSTSASGGPYSTGIGSDVYYIAAGAGGSADDVTLQSSNLPTKRFITNVSFLTITGVAMATVTLRDASGGGGNALSSALPGATAGAISNTTSTRQTASAASSSMFLRRSDSGIAGVLTVSYVTSV